MINKALLPIKSANTDFFQYSNITLYSNITIYLWKLLHVYTSSWLLRSSADTWEFRIPSFRTKSSGQRSFSYQAPVIWNQLPVSIHGFTSVSSLKLSLKTFLFLKTFSSVPLPWYTTLCVSVHVCVCVVCVEFCNYVHLKNVQALRACAD